MKLPLSSCNQSGARLMLGLALLITTYMALTPAPSELQTSINDKFGHVLAFFVLALLSHASWAEQDFGWRFGLPLLAYGLLLEAVQHFIPNRFFSLLDLAADGLGILLYVLALYVFTLSFGAKNIGNKPNTGAL